MNNKVLDHVETSLGKHLNLYEIDYNEINTEQYETLCEQFNFKSYTKQIMLVLYFNKNAVQFSFDPKTTDLLKEFAKLGWIPLEVRLEIFLKHNPNNQDALSMLLVRGLDKLDDLNKESLPSFIKLLERLNNADSMEWLGSHAVLIALAHLPTFANKPILKESPEFQKVLNNLLARIEREMIRDPYPYLYYFHWASLACMSQNPNPWRILTQINFPPGNKKVAVGTSFANLANSLFHNDKEKNGFDFLGDAEVFLRDQDIPKGSFNDSLFDFAMTKIQFLVKYKQYSELEKYLRDLNNKVGIDWPKYTKAVESSNIPALKDVNITKLPNRRKIEEILALPTLGSNEKQFHAILITHNFLQESFDKLHAALSVKKSNFYLTQDTRLPKNSWTLKNANVLIGSGSILPNENKDNSDISELLNLVQGEECKNFNALEKFINQNPDNFEAINMYCLEIAKFLPDESLEQKLFKYSSDTGIPPSVEAYSKIKNKTNWSRLASKIIAENIIRLKDAPYDLNVNPWSILSGWEDLDMSKNSINWYDLLKENADFWYHPTYYMQPQIMPEAVFVKYLKCAEKANDWNALLVACEARFLRDKKKCQSEQILKTWTQAMEKVNVL